MATAIFCIAKTRDQADRIVDTLRGIGGVRDQDISVLFPDRSGTHDFAEEHSTRAPEGAITGAAVGGVTGGVLGLLAGIGALAIPGIGPFIAAGPIMAALSGAAVGAAFVGIGGALVGMGMPEWEAKRYEDSVKGGNILISVHSEHSDETKRIREILKDAGAEDISTSGEPSEAKRLDIA